ncbi:MAG: RpiB/LacA/LacB family sugar-phosphate isomerase, partial [Candidatus Wildermuthbacteria bacterium]|nr:RpiB/LacA/LacB family sugar-phosphate isomerase [Candidatus Wildermuthbacteria bacterium]
MIYLGADHAGFELKEVIKNYLKEQGKEVEDLGA